MTDWKLDEAIGLFYAAANADDSSDDASPPPDPSGGPSQPTPRLHPGDGGGKLKKHMTVAEMQRLHNQKDGDTDDDKQQDMFAGGEKSGLAVQNPNQGGPVDHFKNIMNQAKQNRDRPAASGEEPEPPRPSHFTGRALTLGGDGVESQIVQDPNASARQRGPQLPRVDRTLHLWADGVSIDDGPLFRFDDPRNSGIMAEINRGRAPLALLDVEREQEVNLNLEPHKDENYVQPKKTYKPFSGEGQRLGSPTPGPGPSTATPMQAAPAPTPSVQPTTSDVQLDPSTPIVRLQIRLGDGTRLQSRFNNTHTIGDVYEFVARAATSSQQRAWVLMTTFPNKELNDKTVALGDIGEFKRGGVLVQKWTS